MSLQAGTIAVTIEYAQNLKDQDWFGKQDPYVLMRCGGQTYRTKTHIDGGKNPVWNETFAVNVLNENSVEIEVKDEDTIGRDDLIGTATFSLAKAREHGTDTIQVPVISKTNKKQYGFVSVKLSFKPNNANGAMQQQQQPAMALQPQMMAMPMDQSRGVQVMYAQGQQPAVQYVCAPAAASGGSVTYGAPPCTAGNGGSITYAMPGAPMMCYPNGAPVGMPANQVHMQVMHVQPSQ